MSVLSSKVGGDANAVPVLLRKYLDREEDYRDILGKPVTCNGHENAIRSGGIEGQVAVAAARPGCVGVLVVLDSETLPVCELGPSLLERALTATSKPCLVTLAETMFESWIISSAESMELSGLVYRPSRNPVSLFREALSPVKYVKPVWQPRLASRIDLELATGRSPGLMRLFVKLELLRRA